MRFSMVGPIVVCVCVSTAFAQDVPRESPPTRMKAADKAGQAVVQHNSPEMANPIGQPKRAWWTERDAGLVGGIGGGIVGILGGLIGTLGGCGKARRFVLTICAASAGLGAVSLVVGLIAVVLRQPFSVCYPLLLFGVLVPAIMGPMFFLMRYAYGQRELRRMAVMDAR